MMEILKSVEPISKELVDGFIKITNERYGWEIREDSSQRCSRALHLCFAAIANFLAKVKSTDHPVGLLLEDENGNFQFGAKVEYFPNANEDMPGNWGFSFTFNNEDMNNCQLYHSNSKESKEITLDIAEHQYAFLFQADVNDKNVEETKRILISSIIECAVKTVKQWIDENSISIDPVTTEIRGKVILDAMLDENGIKVGSITPSGELKNIIKNDACIENQKEKEKA